jgi:hypothetical protein
MFREIEASRCIEDFGREKWFLVGGHLQHSVDLYTDILSTEVLSTDILSTDILSTDILSTDI